MSVLRITTTKKELEDEIKRHDFRLLEEWVKLSIKELEGRIRHSKEGGDTAVIQGALRILDDLGEILKS